MCYSAWVDWSTDPVCAPQAMRLRRAVLQIPPKSSVSPGLPLYNYSIFLNHSESTLLQVLIPLHFNFPRISVYRKPGRGCLLPTPEFCNLSLPFTPSALRERRLAHALSRSAHPYHSIEPTLPLFSYSCALFCIAQSFNSFALNHFRTFLQKYLDRGYTLPANQFEKIEEQSTRNREKLRGESMLGKQMCGYLAQIPHQPAPRKQFQRVISDVDLPPIKSLARRSHKVMVVVVPPLAQGQQREQPVVAARVRCLVAPRTEKMRKRIDRKRVVPDQHGAQAKPPNEQRPSANQKDNRSQHHRRHMVILVQPAQFRIFRKVADVFQRRNIIFVGDEPSHVRPQESEERRRMHIQILIRVPVMVPVMSRPPQHSLLRGSHRQKRNHELKHPAGLVRAVREIAVIARGNEKHPNRAKRQTSCKIRPAKMHEKYAESQNVNQYEGQSQKK